MRKSVRLADIAKRLGVSTVTVSNALSGQKGVSDSLRDQIRRTATEMGYQPKNAAAAGVPKVLNIGVIISEKYLGDYPSYYWKIYQELSLLAGSFKCVILFEVLRHEHEAEKKMPLFLTESKIDGLMVLGEISSAYLKTVLERTKLPMLLLDFMKRSIQVPCVMANNYYGMYQMVNYLIYKGHRRIAYVGTLQASSSIMDRYFGYCKALTENGIEVNPDWVIDDRSLEDGQIGNIRLPEQMPTAFACNCDLTAAEVVRILEERGYRVPEDISIVGFDNYLVTGRCDVEITTYEVNLKEMVYMALKSIINAVVHGNSAGDMQFVPGRVVEKESVKARGVAVSA